MTESRVRPSLTESETRSTNRVSESHPVGVDSDSVPEQDLANRVQPPGQLLRPCVVCGELSREARCPLHTTKASRQARGYDAAWFRLSARARRAQPFCSDCGTTEDLTCDHSPEAWARKERGLPIRLCDVDVVCRSCNSKRGAARGVDPAAGLRGPGVRRSSALSGPLSGPQRPEGTSTYPQASEAATDRFPGRGLGVTGQGGPR